MKNLIKITRKDLKGKTSRDFNNGDVIKVGKYYIYINGLKTYVNTEESIIPLKESKMPNYIHDIAF